MTRIWLAAILVLAAGLGWQSWHLTAWRARAEAAESRLVAWAEAARIRADHDRRLARLHDEAVALDHILANREGGDAPLSDYLRDAAGRLWRP